MDLSYLPFALFYFSMNRKELEKELEYYLIQFTKLQKLYINSKPPHLYRNMPDTPEYKRAKMEFLTYCRQTNIDGQLRWCYDRIVYLQQQLRGI